MGHTPGPWVTKYSPHHHVEVFAPNDSRSVCTVFLPIAEYDQDEDNARLIAAAPLMLEALKIIRKASLPDGFKEKIDAVIAKATTPEKGE